MSTTTQHPFALIERAYRGTLQPAVRRLVPGRARAWVSTQLERFDCRPPVGLVRFGDLRRTRPISKCWGMERGQIIDRYYIERFLERHADDVRGRVLEIAEDTYTKRFGGSRVTASEILHATAENPRATIVGDLTDGANLASESFDCLLLTQTIQVIYDVRAVLRTAYRILRPGGVLLATTHGISKLSRWDMDRWGEYWRFTSLSARRLVEQVFPADTIEIRAHGNVLVATAFLYGLAAEDLTPRELNDTDPDYEMIVTIRAVKPAARTKAGR